MDRTITGVSDFVLLRSVAEDVPHMAGSVREHLRSIADKLEYGDKVGQMRCRKCGENVDILIQTMNVSSLWEPLTPRTSVTDIRTRRRPI